MTFIAPLPHADARMPAFLSGRKALKPRGRVLLADEDGARRALASGTGLAAPGLAGSSMEHLARIALG